MSDSPCASVVIPCLNEVDHIGACLDALDAQQGLTHPVEVFVVDGGSEDGTRDVLSQRTGGRAVVTVIDNPQRITPVAMNLGIEAAQSEVVIILGAHAEVASDFVKRNIDALKAHPESGCVGGRVEQVHGDERGRRIGLAMSSPLGWGTRGSGPADWLDTWTPWRLVPIGSPCSTKSAGWMNRWSGTRTTS